MKKFSVKQKLKAFLAAALCVCMAASPLTAFAESLPEQEESILSDNFDELVRKAEEENKEHEAEQIALNSADEGLVVKTYAYVITHMALSWVYDGCSDDSDAFKGNAAIADGIKNMVNLMDIDAYLPFHRNTDI